MGLRLTKGALVTPAPNIIDVQYDITLVKPAIVDESGNVLYLGGFATRDYRTIRTLSFVSGNNVYTPTAGTKALFVECWGAGGSGGGAASSTGGTNNSIAGGGGGGGYSGVWLTGTIPASGTTYDANVGAGGVAATAGSNPGNIGGDTIFRDTTGAVNRCVAKGGAAGLAGGASATALGTRGAGGAGGLASGGTGDFKFDGNAGAAGVCFTVVAATGMVSGAGGAASFGGPAGPSLIASGVSATPSGAGGGSAGSCDAAATNRTSGVGGAGFICIREYA